VDHLSFLLDARIFLKTFAVVFSQEGVYVEPAAGNKQPAENKPNEGKDSQE
jgi:hypothetical protein